VAAWVATQSAPQAVSRFNHNLGLDASSDHAKRAVNRCLRPSQDFKDPEWTGQRQQPASQRMRQSAPGEDIVNNLSDFSRRTAVVVRPSY
jgi:hypothetical protein